MKGRRIFSALLALALLLGLTQPALAADTAAVMQLSATEGTVTVSSASGRSMALRANMRLYSGYQVATSANSYAWINLDSTKLIKLDANTKVEIRSSGKKLEVLLKAGNVYGDVSRPLGADETLDIRTSTAIVGIRGTKFSVAQVRATAQDTAQSTETVRWTTRVQVYEGTVAVSAQQETPETTSLTEGNQLIVDPGPEAVETFVESSLYAQEISGYAAVELVKTPETLENLGIELTPETAQEVLKQDQAEAEQRQTQSDTGKTGLETTDDPNVVWGGGTETGGGETGTGGTGGGGTGGGGGGGTGGGGGGTGGGTTTPSAPYTVTFAPNGGNWGGDTASQSLTTDTAGKLGSAPADPARDGYDFNGWYTAATGGAKVDPATYTFTADTTLYAQWAALYRISFHDGSNTTVLLTDTAGKLTESAPELVSEGFTFDGWYTAATGGTKVDPATHTFTGDTNLYAQWTIKTYTITFDSQSGSEVAPQQVPHGGKVTEPADPTLEGHVFKGWYVSSSFGMLFDFDTPITGTEYSILWAKWEVGQYTVTFNLNGAPAGVTQPVSQTVPYDYKISQPSINEPSGYIFLGWYRDSAGTDAWDFENDKMGGADMTLYAKWEAIYTVTIDPNGGGWGGSTASRSVTTGQGGKLDPADIPATPTRAGYVFVDWYDTDDRLVSLESTFTENTTVHAEWAVEYTITLNPAGGTWADGTAEAKTFKTDRFGCLVGEVPDLSQDNYTFNNWLIGTEIFNGNLETYRFNADTTLTASWVPSRRR